MKLWGTSMAAVCLAGAMAMAPAKAASVVDTQTYNLSGFSSVTINGFNSSLETLQSIGLAVTDFYTSQYLVINNPGDMTGGVLTASGDDSLQVTTASNSFNLLIPTETTVNYVPFLPYASGQTIGSASSTYSDSATLSAFSAPGSSGATGTETVSLFPNAPFFLSGPNVSAIYAGGTAGTGTLTVTYNYTTDAVAAAPEPATWAMMILGFGLVGGVMRRAYRKSEEKFTAKVRSITAA